MRRITIIVPNGSAAVEVYAMATVFRKQNVMKRGPQNIHPVNSRFLTCKNQNPKVCLVDCHICSANVSKLEKRGKKNKKKLGLKEKK